MKGNLTPIGIVMCVVLCVSIVFGVGMFDRQEDGSLSGWNPSNAYNTLISSSTNLSPNVISQHSSAEYSGILVPMKSTPNRMRSRVIAALPREPKSHVAVSSSYSCAPLYATSSASFHSFGGGGYAGGANNTFVVKQGASCIDNPISSSSYAAQSNTSLYAAMSNSAVSSAMLPSMRTSTSSISRAMPGMSTSRASAAMFAPKKAPGLGTQDWGSWLESLIGNTEAGWLYNDGDYRYYDIVALKNWFDNLRNENGNVVIDGIIYTWKDFLDWFFKNGDASGGYGDQNEWWRVPMPDGVGVLIVFAIINMIVIYLRSRGKKIDTLTV